MSDELIDAIEAPRLETGPVLGHDAAAQTLAEALQGGRLAHAWLISGPKGIGKSTLASWLVLIRIVVWYDAASPKNPPPGSARRSLSRMCVRPAHFCITPRDKARGAA